MRKLALTFVGLLVLGTLAFLATGKNSLLGLGLAAAISVALFWSVWTATGNIRGHLKAGLYFDAMTSGALHLGILLLLMYFCWFILSEMIGVKSLGSVPEVNRSKLTVVGGGLVFIAVAVLFARAALFRRRRDRRPQRD